MLKIYCQHAKSADARGTVIFRAGQHGLKAQANGVYNKASRPIIIDPMVLFYPKQTILFVPTKEKTAEKLCSKIKPRRNRVVERVEFQRRNFSW